MVIKYVDSLVSRDTFNEVIEKALRGDVLGITLKARQHNLDLSCIHLESGRGLLTHCLTRFGDTTLESLLRAGVDPNVIDLKHQTCLHVACEYDIHDTIHMLISYGADPNICTQDGTAAHSAVAEGLPNVVKYLYELGANINICAPRTKSTPLMNAVKYRNLECVKALLSCNADVTLKDSNGYDVFSLSSIYYNAEIYNHLHFYKSAYCHKPIHLI